MESFQTTRFSRESAVPHGFRPFFAASLALILLASVRTEARPLEFSKGWNLFSVPDGARAGSVCDAVREGGGQGFAVSGLEYIPCEALGQRSGMRVFWASFPTGVRIDLPETSERATAITLQPGWNFVPYSEEAAADWNDVAVTDGAPEFLTGCLEFDPVEYSPEMGGYRKTGRLEPGGAYLAYARRTCLLTLGGEGALRGDGGVVFAPFGSGDVEAYRADGSKRLKGRLLIAAPAGTNPAAVREAAEKSGGRVVGYNPRLNLFQLKFENSQAADAAAGTFKTALPGAIAAPDQLAGLDGLPDDPPFTQGERAWWGLEAVGAPAFWGRFDEAGRPVVAVADTGVSSHPDLSGRLLRGHNLVDPASGAGTEDVYGHGTGVAGIIAAVGDNGQGIAGVCRTCAILPVKVCDDAGRCPLFAVLNGIVAAAEAGADVVNLSLGLTFDSADDGASMFDAAVAYARSKGAALVASAGNGGGDADRQFPAAHPDVMSVGALLNADAVSPLGNDGSTVELYAPGVEIQTLTPDGGTRQTGGSSVAAAFVSGALGALLGWDPDLTAAEAAGLLRETARPLAGESEKTRPDLERAGLVRHFRRHPIRIAGLDVESLFVSPGETAAIAARIDDPHLDAVSMVWSQDGAALEGMSGSSLTWTAPEKPGDALLSFAAEDPAGNRDEIEALMRVAVSADDATRLVIAPTPEKVYVGETLVLSASAFDDFGNSVDVAAAWRIAEGSGTIGSDGTMTPSRAGLVAVEAEIPRTKARRELNVVEDVTPTAFLTGGATFHPGETVQLTAEINRADFESFTSEFRAAAGTVEQTGLLTALWTAPTEAGETWVEFEVSEAGRPGSTIRAAVWVETDPEALALVEVTPKVVAVERDKPLAFKAVAYDIWGNPYDGPFLWSASPNLGRITADGEFTGGAEVRGFVTARTNGVEGSATVTVVPPLNAAPNAACTVNSTSDVLDISDGHETLRDCVYRANNSAGADVVRFDSFVFPTASNTIGLINGPLYVTDPDGLDLGDILTSAETDLAEVVVDGAGNGADPAVIMTATSANNSLHAFSFINFATYSVRIHSAGSANNQIQGNRFGSKFDGTRWPNEYGIGLFDGTRGCTIGGNLLNSYQANVIGPNDKSGIVLDDADYNTIKGNFIGVSETMADFGNGEYGMLLTGGADHNTIGGNPGPDAIAIGGDNAFSFQHNVISKNDVGVRIEEAGTDYNVFKGNFIGTNETGMIAQGNASYGVEVCCDAQNNEIGQRNFTGWGNVISGNGGDGVRIHTSCMTRSNGVRNNQIGLAVDGFAAMGNGGSGVRLAIAVCSNAIGGTTDVVSPSKNEGNTIGYNAEHGIYVTGTSANNSIRSNKIGLDYWDVGTAPNGGSGIFLDGSSALEPGFGPGATNIGGDRTYQANYIAGNAGPQIRLRNTNTLAGDQNAGKANKIQGNYVGLDLAYAPASVDGILLDDDAKWAQIGGATGSYFGNVIWGVDGHGVSLTGDNVSQVKIQGNTIGSNEGLTDLANGNTGDGIHVECGAGCAGISNLTIGGSSASQLGNTIALNGGRGMYFEGPNFSGAGSIVQGNLVGLRSSGAAGYGNGQDGIRFNDASDAEVGGSAVSGEGNVVSGNGGHGIYLTAGSTGVKIKGNAIGTKPDGTDGGIANAQDAVRFDLASNDCLVGSDNVAAPNSDEGNLIAFSNAYGVFVGDGVTGTAIRANRIFSSADKGIHHNNGASNNGIAYPSIDTLSKGGAVDEITISGSGAVAGDYIDVFRVDNVSSPAVLEEDPDPPLIRGEAYEYLGSAAAGAGGAWTVPNVKMAEGGMITAVRTDAITGDSSEFAPNHVGCVTNDSDSGRGSLRYMLDVTENQHTGFADSIFFCADVTIQLTSPLDMGPGYTFTDFPATMIDGTGADVNVISDDPSIDWTFAVLAAAASATIRNLNMDGAGISKYGVWSDGAAQTTIEASSFTGFAQQDGSGVTVSSAILIQGPSADGALISGNTIDSSDLGVVLSDGPDGAVITNNVITGNGGGGSPWWAGIAIDSGGSGIAGVDIIDNQVGGLAPNGFETGVFIEAGVTDANFIRNVVGGNAQYGFYADSAGVIRFSGNYLGTDASGMAAEGNGVGAYLANCAQPGVLDIADNVFSASASGDGLEIVSCDNLNLDGNMIGAASDGSSAGMGNAGDGVDITASDHIAVGSVSTNIIVDNNDDGFVVRGTGAESDFTFDSSYFGASGAGDQSGGNGKGGSGHGLHLMDIAGAAIGSTGGCVFSDNIGGAGIRLENAHNASILNSFIGVGIDGDTELPNDHGVEANDSDSLTIGSAGQGNVISMNNQYGIQAANSGSAYAIADNIIGLSIDGASPKPNGANGIYLNAIDDATVSNNVISENGAEGVLVSNGSTFTLSGNMIGTDSGGVDYHGNGGAGVDVSDFLTAIVTNNVISGNFANGLNGANGTSYTFTNNRIGVETGGSFALENQGNGVNLTAVGTGSFSNNNISSNLGDGLWLDTGAGFTFTNNRFGMGSGDEPLGNAGMGMRMNDLDGSFFTGNAIGNNGDVGVTLQGGSDGNRFFNNRTGVDGSGGAAGNGSHGLWVEESTDNRWGGTTATSHISNNGGWGALFESAVGGDNWVASSTVTFNGSGGVGIGPNPVNTGNLITRNLIYENTGPGIDLGLDGITENDSDDSDAGANTLINYPTIDTIVETAPGVYAVYGTAGPGYVIELFQADESVEGIAADENPDGSGERHGEARYYLGTATTDLKGLWRITGAVLTNGQIVTATARDPNTNDTSEFAANEDFKVCSGIGAPDSYSAGPVNLDELYQPYDLVMWGGHLLVADTMKHRIAEYDPTTRPATFIGQAGGIGSASGKLNRPADIRLYQGGAKLLIADYLNGRVQVCDNTAPFGAADPPAALTCPDVITGLTSPISADSDAAGNVYVAMWDGRVWKYDASFTRDAAWSLSPAPNRASKIRVDENNGMDRMYLVNPSNHTVAAYTLSSGALDTTWGGGDGYFGTPGVRSNANTQLSEPWGLDVRASDNRVFVSDGDNNRLLQLNADGTLIINDVNYKTGVSFNHPNGISIVSDNEYYLMDTHSWKVVPFKKVCP